MPWQVPITVDGLEYPVTFNTESEPSQQDYDDAVQQILSQKGQAIPAPEKETPGYLSQLGSALGLGYRQMKSGVGATFNALTGDTADVAAEMAEMSKLQREQQATQTPEDVVFMRGLDEAEKAYEKASGPLETLGALTEYPAAVLAQPGAAFKTAIQSAPNALISGATSLAGYGLGGLAGGAAGIETGPGAILTGIAGAMAGGAVSNTLMEAGPAIFDVLNERTQGAASNMTADEISAYLQQNPDVVDEGMKTGAIRGSVIGAIEALGVKGSGRLLTMPERAAARAVQKELVAAGVDVASKEAVDQALLDPALKATTKAAAEAAKSQFSSAGNIARMTGAAAIDTGSAGVGEIAAQAAAGQDISTKEAFMEMLGDAALSLPMSVATKAVEGAQYMLNPSLVTEAGQASAQNLAATGNAESAIAQDDFNQAAAEVLPPTEPAVQPVKTAEAVEVPDMTGLSDLGETEGDLVGDFGLELRSIQQEGRQPADTLFELPPPQKRNLGQLRDAVIRQMDETQSLVESGDISSLTPEYDRLLNKYRRLEALLGKIEAKMLPASLPETELSVVDKEAPAGTPVQAAPLSEGAERNRAVIAEAAAKLRGEAPQTISAGLQAAIPQQAQQENAPDQIPDKESVRQEPQDGAESRTPKETGVGDQLLSAAPSEEEVATFQAKLDSFWQQKPTSESIWELAESAPEGVWVDDGTGLLRAKKSRTRISKKGNQIIEFETEWYNEETKQWEPLPQGYTEVQRKADGSFSSNNRLPSAWTPGSFTEISTGNRIPTKPTVVSKPTKAKQQQPITPQGTPTPATGMLTPGGVGPQRGVEDAVALAQQADPENMGALLGSIQQVHKRGYIGDEALTGAFSLYSARADKPRIRNIKDFKLIVRPIEVSMRAGDVGALSEDQKIEKIGELLTLPGSLTKPLPETVKEKASRDMEALLGLPRNSISFVRSGNSKVFQSKEGSFYKLSAVADIEKLEDLQRQLRLLSNYSNVAEVPDLNILLTPEDGGAVFVLKQKSVGVEGAQILYKTEGFTKKDQSLFAELQSQNPLSTNLNPNPILRVETDSSLKNMGLVVGEDGNVRAIAFDFDGVSSEDFLTYGKSAVSELERKAKIPMTGVPLSAFSPNVQKAILKGQQTQPGATGEPVQAAPSAAQAVKATAPGPNFQRVASEMDTMPLKELSEYAKRQGMPQKEAVGFARDYIKKWASQTIEKANSLFGKSIRLGFFPSKISKDGMRIVASGRGLSHKNGIEVDDSQSPLHSAWVAAHEFAHQIFPTQFLPKEASLAKGTHPKGLDDIKSKSKAEKLASDFANWLVSKEYPEHSDSIPSIPNGMRDYFESLIQSQTTPVATQTETAAPSAKGAAVASAERQPSGGSIPEVVASKTPESQPSTKENAAVEQIDRLVSSNAKPEEMDKFVKSLSDDEFNSLIESEAFDVDKKLAIKPKDTYDAKRIKRRKFVDQNNATAVQARKTADQIFKEEEAELAKEIKKGEEVRRARKSVIDPAKTNIKYGKVTTAIVEAARRQLQNSGEIPNAILTRIYASPEAFLADRSNQRYFPVAYASLMAEPNVEGLYADKTTFVFASNIGVSDLDRNIAEARGISEEQAAARRVIAHENGHRGVDLFEPWELREFRSFVNRTYTTEEIDNLVRLYTEFADWRTNPVSRNEALEEIFQKKFERLVKIPTGGLWDDIVQFLKRVWRRLTGRKGDPTLQDMKDVVRLLRNAMRRTAVPSYTLNNGGEVKLSLSDRFQGVTPAQDAEYLAAVQRGDMETAQRMVDEAAKAAGYNVGPVWHGHTGDRFTSFSKDKLGQNTKARTASLGFFFSETEHVSQQFEGFGENARKPLKIYLTLKNPIVFKTSFVRRNGEIPTDRYGRPEIIKDAFEAFWEMVEKMLGKAKHEISSGELQALRMSWEKLGYDAIIFNGTGMDSGAQPDNQFVVFSPEQIKSADTVTYDDAGNVIPLSRRFQTAPPDIRFSRVEYASDYSSASSAGAQLTRDTVYDEQIIKMRDAIRRAYERGLSGDSAKDAEYMAAVEAGDMVKAQRMVDEMNLSQIKPYSIITERKGFSTETLVKIGEQAVSVFRDPENGYWYFADKGGLGDVIATNKKGAIKAAIERIEEESNGAQPSTEVLFFDWRNDKTIKLPGFYIRFGEVPESGKSKKGHEPGLFEKGVSVLKAWKSPDGVFVISSATAETGPSDLVSGLEDRPAYIAYGDDTGEVGSDGEPLLKNVILTEQLINNRIVVDDPSYIDQPITNNIEGQRWETITPTPDPLSASQAIIRDVDGNVIPLSQRSDTGNNFQGGNLAMPLDELYSKANAITPMTENEFGNILQDLYEDNGAVLQEGESAFDVFTPEGRRAGFAVIMPKRAVASKIETGSPAVEDMRKKLDDIDSGSLNAFSKARPIKDTDPETHVVKSHKSYQQAAIEFVDELTKDGTPIENIGESLFSDDFLRKAGLKNNIPALSLVLNEVMNRVSNQERDQKNPPLRRYKLGKLQRRLAAYWQEMGTTSGRDQGVRSFVQSSPRYRWMYLFNKAEQKAWEDRRNIAREKMVDTADTAEKLNRETAQAGEVAGEVAADELEENQDDIDLAIGEESLDAENKSLFEKVKDWLREIGAAMRHIKALNGGAKMSLSAEQRNAISKMTKEEALAFIQDRQKKINTALKKILGEESDAKTPEQKTTRKKREKMVQVAKKRAEQGKPIEVTSVRTADVIEGIFTGFNDRDSIINEVGDALLKAAEQRKVKPKQKTAIQDLIAAIRQTLTANLKGDQIKADQPSLGKLLGKTFAQQGSEAALFAKSWEDGRKKVRAMLAEMGIEEDSLDQELDAIMPPTPTLAYAPAAAKKAINVAIKEAGLSPRDALSNPAFFRETIMEKFNEAAAKDNLTEEGWNKSGKALAEKAINEFIDAARIKAEERASKNKEKMEKRKVEIADNRASQLIYSTEERFRQGSKDLTTSKSGDSINKAFRDQVKSPVSKFDFFNRLAKLNVSQEVSERLFKTAARERADLEAMEAYRRLDRQRAAGERADAQAQRLIFAKERLKRQSGFTDIENSQNKDTIIKAFSEQVQNPVSLEEFTQRLLKLKVSSDVSGRLFRAAAREKTDLQAMEIYRRLEGPDALKAMQRDIALMRRGEEIPLQTPIPWRKLLSQKASTVEDYRQRIFDAISSQESLSKLDDAQKAKLADLMTQAWEANRDKILDRMVENVINKERAAKRITDDGAEKLQQQRSKIVEDINLGILDEERLMKHLADKFGIKSEFTEAERANIDRLLDILQDDKLNEVKRNKAAYELLEALSSATKIPFAKLLADYWVSSVLSGVNTAASIAMAVASGAYELTSGAFRILRAGFTNPKELPAEIAASFKAMAEFLKAFGREGRLAWQYLVTGDRALLDPSLHNVRNDLNYDSIGKTVSLAERMAKSDKLTEKVMGIWMRSVSRLLTALDNFNSGVTKAGALPIVFRQLDLNAEGLKLATEKYNLQLYRDKVIQRDFNGNKPTTAHDKALVDSYAKAEMMADLQQFGKFSENADFFGQQGAMTLDPTGIGGFIYSSIKSLTGGATNRADKFLAEAEREWKQADGVDKTTKGLQLALAYFLQFGAYNSANLAGLRFARFAGNKFNQGLSFIPGIGLMRMYEATAKDSKIEAKDAFTDMIMRNQLAGLLLSLAGFTVIQAIMDEPDDEKRGWFINGGWANLTPDRKQQKLAAGQKEFTIGIGGKVYNYQNWPISPILAAIGSLSDLVRYSREQWNEKSIADRLVSAAASGVFSAGEIPALSGFQTLFGNNLSSKDPNEKRLDRFAKVMAGWGGGFVPRILKDIDFMADPGLRKYESLWEQTASHIPVYRRYSGEEYYDILGKQIERKVWPGSREFMELETDPEYRTLGKLNSRGIWLTPANAEHRMVGKGRNKRKLTQEEADAYSLETGKGYRQMLLRYGSRLEQMPTERARAFLMDKADEVRDRALKKIVR